MATKFAKGDAVKLVSAIPTGPVKAIRMSEDGVFSYLVSWEDESGQPKTRWFEEDKLTLA